MQTSTSNANPSSLHFSGHETFPLRQLWLRKAYESLPHSGEAPKSVFASEDAIVRFGVGKNMVMSIRHWALACGFLVEGEKGGYIATSLARKIFESLDPYLEHPASAWLIHWQLAGIGRKSTTWWWLFNRIPQQTFDREAIFQSIKQYCSENRHKISDSTLRRDVDVCLASYQSRSTTGSKEDVAESVLAELPLIQATSSNSFSFVRGPKKTLPDALFAFALIQYWELTHATAVLPFEKIVHDYGSPGRVFKLDDNSVGERVHAIEEVTRGALVWTDSGGIRQVNRRVENFDTALIESLLEASFE